MSYGRASSLWTLAFVILLCLPSSGQSVISTHSGVVHYFEGTVYLNDQPLEFHPGKFSNVPRGGVLRTEQGRAEVLLTPGVILRVGEKTAIRMTANELSNTRIELLAGSAVVDSAEPVAGTSVTLSCRTWKVHSSGSGAYRIDFNPPYVWVLDGKAEVSTDGSGGPISVDQGMSLALAPILVPDRSALPPQDSLSIWADGRQQSISADNAIAANIQDPASIEASGGGADSFTTFPMLGVLGLGSGLSNSYSSMDPYQPGFNSLYLPGYTYLPVFLGFWPGGSFGRIGVPPNRLPSRGFFPYPVPRGPIVHPMPVRTYVPPPVAPRTVAPHPVGIHPGIHR